jgi:hypothetical protein
MALLCPCPQNIDEDKAKENHNSELGEKDSMKDPDE